MVYIFVERRDDGKHVIATVQVEGTSVVWTGPKTAIMKKLLLDTVWRLLGDMRFDLKNIRHYEKLPQLLTGSRLWVNEQ